METQFTGSRLALRWREIRAMGLGVAWWRARYEVKKRLGKLAKPEPLDVNDPAAVLGVFTDPPADADALLAQLRDHPEGRTFFDRPDPQRTAETIKARCDVDATIAAADAVVAHTLVFQGQRFEFPDGPIDWHFDPPSGKSWRKVPWNRVDIRSDRRLGDVKFVWELNRHQFWPTLGRAWQLTGDKRYVTEWANQFDSWCEQNPVEVGVNWYSNLEHALRLVSWWTSAKLMLDSDAIGAERLLRLIGLLVAKCRHIVSDLDYSIVNMANNHLIGDAMGLAFVGMALPELREAAQWRELGLKILWQEARTQILADGSSFECAASYHRFTLHFYLISLIMADLNDVAVPADVRQRVEGMAEFVRSTIRSDGSLPQFGDWDSGLGYRLNDAPVQDFRPVLSTAAVLFERPDFKAAAGPIDQETLWLLGGAAADTYDALDDVAPAPANIAFSAGGYFVGSNLQAGSHLFVQNTPFTSHTHADLLSVAWHLDGNPVLVDTGTYTYNGDWTWRTWFRQTAAHNTVTIDRRGQALAHRAFRWLLKPKSRTNFFARQGRFCFDGQHNGFRKWGITHRRVLLELTDRAWLCLDIIDGRGSHAVNIHWNLAPDLEAGPVLDGPTIAVTRDGSDVLTLAAAATDGMAVDVARGRTDPPAGWYSCEYGIKEPATSIRLKAPTKLPFVAATVVAAADCAVRPVAVSRTGNRVEVELDAAGEAMTVRYDLAASASGAVELGEIIGPGDTREKIRTERAEG